MSKPTERMCAVLVYSRAAPSVWLLSDRVLRVSEAMVGGTGVTVVSGTDDGGRAVFDGLRLVEIGG